MFEKFIEIVENAILNERLANKYVPKELFVPIDYTMDLGGKRLRPVLCLIAANMFCKDWEKVINQAIALEIFHNFTLLHDDLMDNSPLRRGKYTVHKKWGSNAAILSGDAMCILAYEYLIKTINPDKLPFIITVFNNTALDVCRGQQYDMDFEHRKDVTSDEYLEMIRLKTAVLLGVSLQIGALAAGADQDISKKLYDIGVSVGIAFQIQDDILDVYSDEKTFGKPIGGDICNSKKTMLLLYTKSKLSAEDCKYLDSLLALPETENNRKIKEVTALYNKVNAKVVLENMCEDYISNAFDLIDSLSITEESKRPLIEIIQKLIDRKK